jgi:hypothetical protein
MSDGDWFAPKAFGLGAGTPIAWQGWALTVGFVAAVAVAAFFLAAHHRALFIIVVAIGALAFSVIAARHTRGGWKWRWGGEK